MPKRRIIPYQPYLLKLARKLRKRSTLGEILLWQQLRSKQLGYVFKRQRPIDNYIVDFFCPDLMLVIEIDGASHDHPDIGENDLTRQARLEALGLLVLRFSEGEVVGGINAVLETIERTIGELERGNRDFND